MPGNEKDVIQFLLENMSSIELPLLGKIQSIQNPTKDGQFEMLDHVDQVKTQNASKKADIFINGIGISIKQSGGSFAFNRMQRKDLQYFFNLLGFSRADEYLSRIDFLVDEFHKDRLKRRNQPSNSVFYSEDFYSLVRYLMLKGSPGNPSPFPAELILTAPRKLSSVEQISIQNFDEYFSENDSKLEVSIRRCWVGQMSDSEHGRAVAIANSLANSSWVYNTISGNPRSGWRLNWPEKDRKTVYFLMIEKVK